MCVYSAWLLSWECLPRPTQLGRLPRLAPASPIGIASSRPHYRIIEGAAGDEGKTAPVKRPGACRRTRESPAVPATLCVLSW